MTELTLRGELNLPALVVAHANLLERAESMKQALSRNLGRRHGLFRYPQGNNEAIYCLNDELLVRMARDAGLLRTTVETLPSAGPNINTMQTFLRPDFVPQKGDIAVVFYADHDHEVCSIVDVYSPEAFDAYFKATGLKWLEEPKKAA